jgi:hypothetical protein
MMLTGRATGTMMETTALSPQLLVGNASVAREIDEASTLARSLSLSLHPEDSVALAVKMKSITEKKGTGSVMNTITIAERNMRLVGNMLLVNTDNNARN